MQTWLRAARARDTSGATTRRFRGKRARLTLTRKPMSASGTPGRESRRTSPAAAALLDADDATLFPKLTEAQLALLVPLGHVRETEVDEVLFRDGDAGYDPMVVLTGAVAVLAGGGA